MLIKKKKFNPKNTIIAADLHGVLFEHNYKKMFQLFWHTKQKHKLARAVISPALWLDLIKLKKKGAVAEEYIVRLADTHHRLKPFVPVGIQIANAQKPIEPVINILKKLKQNGCQLYLFSNIGGTIFADLQKKFPDIFSLFEGFTTASQSNGYRRKPGTDAFQFFLKTHNGAKKTVILIDDKQKNIRGANKNGIIGIFFESAQQLENELQKLGVLMNALLV